MHGKVNEIGVHARDPKTEMNLSSEFPRDIQNPTVSATMIVRDKFLSHILFLDFGMPLKM